MNKQINPPRTDNFELFLIKKKKKNNSQIGGKMLSLCWPKQLQDFCCSELSDGPKTPVETYGISKAAVKNDSITQETRTGYTFSGHLVAYSELKLSVHSTAMI